VLHFVVWVLSLEIIHEGSDIPSLGSQCLKTESLSVKDSLGWHWEGHLATEKHCAFHHSR